MISFQLGMYSHIMALVQRKSDTKQQRHAG